MINLIEIEETGSTNLLMAGMLDSLSGGTVVLARSQSRGRGQRGNSWEAEPGKNVTMSMLLRDLPVGPRRQFIISEAVALSVADTVSGLLPGMEDKVAVKWPNDIYVADRKIAGILIECGILGDRLTHVIAGIGLNINQTEFRSDAPNPESVARLTGRDDYEIAPIAISIAEKIMQMLDPARFDADAIHSHYTDRLWRRTGSYPWRRRDDGVLFRASIASVAQEGFLTLREEATGQLLPPFAFKEVEAVLGDQNG